MCFSIFEEMLSCFTYIYLRVSNFEEILSCFTCIISRDENFYAHVLHLDLFELSKATYEITPKVIDIQEGYNKNFHEDHWTK